MNPCNGEYTGGKPGRDRKIPSHNDLYKFSKAEHDPMLEIQNVINNE